MDGSKQYQAASQKTATQLQAIAQSASARALSHLTLPEIEAVVAQIARLVPAGNIPALILSGLLRLSGRQLPPKTAQQDIDLLLTGVAQTLDTAVYGAFFAGPAVVIWGYQSLLRLAGIDPQAAFPAGPWQFYVDYAMRDDTARHTNETHGFATVLSQQQIRLSETDRITAWVMAAVHSLHQYDALLTNEWRERVNTHLLSRITKSTPDTSHYAGLYRGWAKQRPYGLGQDALTHEAYPSYRRRKFDEFMAEQTRNLPPELHNQWSAQIHQAEAEDLPAYSQQMSILAYLDPGPYGENRTPITLAEAHVGLIYQGSYYLIPICNAGTGQPVAVQSVRAMVAGLQNTASTQSTSLTPLARLKRAAWPNLRPKLSQPLLKELDRLRLAPILINCDLVPGNLPLSELRQAERGLGQHALTIFDTGQTFVFDQSHIFFDAVWGVALVEIMTQEALTWTRHLTTLDNPPPTTHKLPQPLNLDFTPTELTLIQQLPAASPEVGAENKDVDLELLLKLRRRFKQRNECIQLTVNDLLILYRAIHAVTYQPDPRLVAELTRLTQTTDLEPAAAPALKAMADQTNPAIVMPIDASSHSPRDRLHPITFAVPLNELNLLTLHQQTIAALHAYKNATGDRSQLYAEFDRLQRAYLATLAGFGDWLSKTKAIAQTGESFSVGTLKLLAHIPTPLQRLLEKIPNNFELLNDLTKGKENISNVGAVVPASTLTRFMSAKDDNEQKTLIWGIITDAQGTMHLTLRDFRPHVGLLTAGGHKKLASHLTQHYLAAYAYGLNSYLAELLAITQNSWESRLHRSEDDRV